MSWLSICRSAWLISAPSWRIFMKNWYLNVFKNPDKKIQISLKLDKDNGYLTWGLTYIFDQILLNSSYIEKCFRQNCRESQNTHFVFITCRLIYGIMWRNIVKLSRQQITIWNMFIAFWISNATNMHSQYIIIGVFSVQQWLHNCTSVLCYMNVAFLLCFSPNAFP